MSLCCSKRNKMEQNEILTQIRQELSELKKIVKPPAFQNPATDKWVRRADAMAFLNYGPTQMAFLEKSGEIVVAKVGKRKFINRESLEKWIEKNILQNPKL